LPTDRLKETNVGVIYYGSKGYAVHGGRIPGTNNDNRYAGGIIFDPDGNVVQSFVGRDDSLLNGYHISNFVDAVRSRKREALNADIELGHVSAALAHLANVSYRLGETLPVSEVEKRLAQVKKTLSVERLETLERLKQHLTANQLNPETTQFRLGTLLALDGKAEQFIGPESRQANPLLTREYRKGFEVPASAQVV
jgi:hypothetical protein